MDHDLPPSTPHPHPLPTIPCSPLTLSSPCFPDGSYSEHGREIFDQEGETGGEGDHKKKGPPGGKVKSKVAKPGGIKAMVMGMGGVATKKREV